jgi:hypothetical protein
MRYEDRRLGCLSIAFLVGEQWLWELVYEVQLPLWFCGAEGSSLWSFWCFFRLSILEFIEVNDL